MLRDRCVRGVVASMMVSFACGLSAQDFPVEAPPVAKPVTPETTPVTQPPVKPPAPQPTPAKPPVKPVTKTVAKPVPPKPDPTAGVPTPTTAPTDPSATNSTSTTLSGIIRTDAPPTNPEATSTTPGNTVGTNPLTVPNFRDALEDVPTELAPLQLMGEWIQPNSRRELRWASSQSFDGATVTTPVIVFHGNKPGPRLCMTAAVHGDEINGIEIIRRVLNDLRPAEMSGTVIAVPIVNYLGYARGSRYLPDRRDLNRFFPGSRTGSSASRIAHGFFHDIAKHCHALVDFHTGSFDRSNLPQVRGDLRSPAVLEFTRGFGATAVLHSPGSRGMLRRAVSEIGIPAVTFEVGSPMRLEPGEIDVGVQAMHTMLHKMGMTRSFRMWSEPQATFYAAKWVRADTGGMLFTTVKLGDRVREGQRLGKVVDPLANTERAILSPVRGRVLGMALNQIVLPGFAAFHLGVEADQQTMIQSVEANEATSTGAEEEDADESRLEQAQDDEDIER